MLTSTQYQCFSSCVPVYTRGVHLRYDDLREAAEAKDILSQHGFAIDSITGYEFALAKSQDTAQLNEFEGQVMVPVTIQPYPDHASFEFTNADLVEVSQAIEIAAGIFGTVRNCVHVETHDTKMTLVFRVEFHSVDAATRAVQSLTLDSIWGVNNSVSLPFISQRQWKHTDTLTEDLSMGDRRGSPLVWRASCEFTTPHQASC